MDIPNIFLSFFVFEVIFLLEFKEQLIIVVFMMCETIRNFVA